MRYCTHRWPQSGHFFSKLGNFFPIFEKGQGRPTPFASLVTCLCTKMYSAWCKWKLWLLQNSKFNNFLEYCVSCHILIPSWFHNYNFIDIWCVMVISPLLHCCFNDNWFSANLIFRGAAKLYFMHYLRVVIALFSTGYISLRCLPILLVKLGFRLSVF